MFDVVFEFLVMVFIFIIAVLPLFSTAATIYLIKLFRDSAPPNEVLKTAAITATLVTLGGMWWAFVALRRIFLGPENAALPEIFILMHGISLVMILVTPIIKVTRLVRLMHRPITPQQVEDMKRLEYDLMTSAPTENEAEDLKFGIERRKLEDQHKVDRG